LTWVSEHSIIAILEVQKLIRALGDKTPNITESAFISESAYIVGEVEIGENCIVLPGAVIRGDFGGIRIGKNVVIEDNAVVHGASPCLDIGDDVTIGHGAVVNARRIGSKVLVGMNATVLHQVETGDRCVIAAGAVVTEGMKIPSDSFVAGVPAKVIGKTTEKQLKWVERAPQVFSWWLEKYKKERL